MNVLRFGWSSVVQAHVSAGKPDGNSIACAIEPDGDSAHVLLVDLQMRNAGTSLTNCAEFAILHVMRVQGWPVAFAQRATWVEMDSLGWFDRIEPTFGHASVPSLRWVPVTAASAAPRTLEAYLAAYGAAGARSLDALALAGLIPHLSSRHAVLERLRVQQAGSAS